MAQYRYPYFRGVLAGDVERGKTYVKVGESQLNILSNQLLFQGLKQGTRRVEIDQDTIINVSINHHVRTVEIWCRPTVPVEREKKERARVCFCSCCFSEAVVVRVGGTERDSDGNIIFQGDFDWGDPRLRYDLDICYKRDRDRYEFYRVENVRPSDFTRYEEGSQGIVLLTDWDVISKCYLCDDCGGDPEGEDTGCEMIDFDEGYDIEDLVLLPISFSEPDEETTYSPVLIASTAEMENACVSRAKITDITFPVNNSNPENKVICDSLNGVFGNNIDADCKYNGYTGAVKDTKYPSCAFRKDESIFVIHVPVKDSPGDYKNYAIAHDKEELPVRSINGVDRPVPFDDVLYLATTGYQASTDAQMTYLYDFLRGELFDIKTKDTFEDVIQPLSDADYTAWQERTWGNRNAITLDTIKRKTGSAASYFQNAGEGDEGYTGNIGFWFYTQGSYQECGSGSGNALVTAGCSYTNSPTCFSLDCGPPASPPYTMPSAAFKLCSKSFSGCDYVDGHTISAKPSSFHTGGYGDTSCLVNIYSFNYVADIQTKYDPQQIYESNEHFSWSITHTLFNFSLGKYQTSKEWVTEVSADIGAFANTLDQDFSTYGAFCVKINMSYHKYGNIGMIDDVSVFFFGDNENWTYRHCLRPGDTYSFGTYSNGTYQQNCNFEAVEYNDSGELQSDILSNADEVIAFDMETNFDLKNEQDIWDLFNGVRTSNFSFEFTFLITNESRPGYNLH